MEEMLYTGVALKQPSNVGHTSTKGKRGQQQTRLAAATAHSTSLSTSLWVTQHKVIAAHQLRRGKAGGKKIHSELLKTEAEVYIKSGKLQQVLQGNLQKLKQE